MSDSRSGEPVQFGTWWLPFGDRKCQRHFEGGGIQVDHLMRALPHVKKWTLALDGGAHVGSWTRPLAERFGHVVAYELAPDTFECLRRNTLSLSNVRIVNAAIGHRRGRVGVQEPGHTLGRSVAEGGDIPMLRIDDEKLPALDFLKLDLEGYEYFGLKGAEKTIRKFKPVILVEDKGHGLKYGVPENGVRHFLQSLGYVHILRMKPDHLYIHGNLWTRFWGKIRAKRSSDHAL